MEQADEENWVYDSSLDHKGKVPLRASTGAWRAALFIIVAETCERLSYFGLSTNLIIYLTKVLHQELKIAAKNVNYWHGVATLTPLLGGFIADSYFGRFSMVLCCSVIYLGALILLVLSQLIPILKPCSSHICHQSPHLHEIIFFTAIYMISLGTGGQKPALQSFGGDQFDDDHAAERKQKMSFFNWWNCGLASGLLLGVTLIIYIQDKAGWAAVDVVLASMMGISLAVFVAGRLFYRYREPEGSPLTPMMQVVVAAMAKRDLPHPRDAGELYEVLEPHDRNKKRLLRHTNQFKFLDKAAILEHQQKDTKKDSPWRLATVTQVEETKLFLAMFPIWLTSLTSGLSLAQVSTFFVKQASVMNRRLTSNFELPPASAAAFTAIGITISVAFYDRILVPFLRRTTGNERGISILRRIGIGMAFSVAGMAVAALVEKKRLGNIPKDMSVFWLVPQFMIVGFGDGFTLVGLQEYFYDQVPDSMRSLGIAIFSSVIGVGSFLSSLLITVVDHVSEKEWRSSWFAKDLNRSRLDLFYWLLAAINAVNLCWYVFIASRYSYKSVQRRIVAGNSSRGDGESSNSV